MEMDSKYQVHMDKYQYLPLNDNEVRVLELLPGQGDDPVICDIKHINLATKPQYEALSYEWGSPDVVCQVTVQESNNTIATTRSLFNALRSLRVPEKPRTIWADGICINQLDMHERSKQVMLMGQLYKEASCVVVYGGEESEHLRTGLPLIRKLWALLDSYGLETLDDMYRGGEVSTKLDFSQERLVQELGFPPADDPAWNAVRLCIPQSWAARAWMIQECVLNKNIVMQYGQVILPWDALPAFCHYSVLSILPSCLSTRLKESETLMRSNYEVNMLGTNLMHLRTLRYSTTKEEPLSLSELLLSTLSFNCTDERDKIYCLLGIASDAEQLGIKPDYEATTENVYIDAAVRILQNSDHLDLLSNIRPKDSSLDLPSWVPDWSNPGGRIAEPLVSAYYYDGLNKFNACAEAISSPRFNMSQTQLTLGAAFVDKVAYNSKLFTHRRNYSEYFKWLEDHLKMIGMSQRCQNDILTALWKTLCADDSLVDESCFQAWWNFNSPKSSVNYNAAGRHEEHKRRVFWASTCVYSGSRSFSITEDGYFCLTPSHTQIGDSVVILKGGRAPFIVREEGGYYILIGDAYVHGLMNGEFFDNKSEHVEFQDITFI